MKRSPAREFSKYEGAGNDFILIDDRPEFFPWENASFIQKLCHRKFGVGADGILLLQNDPLADFRMRVFNADGSEAESCGNGLRCFLKFLQEKGFAEKRYKIRTGDRIVEGEIIEGIPSIDMGIPQDLRLRISTEIGEAHFANSGVPHVVHFVPHVEKVDLRSVGPFLRHHPLFQPKGANASIAAVQEDGVIRVRTFERGVEEETLACGTAAVAVAAIARGLFPPKKRYQIVFSGGSLDIEEEGGHFWMRGPANRVFSGKFFLSPI